MIIYKGEDIRQKWAGLISITDIKRPILPLRAVQLATAAGMVGAYLGRVKRGVRVIEVSMRLLGDLETKRATARAVGAFFDDDKEQPLSFADEPDKTYYAIADGNFDLDESTRFVGEFKVSFVCPDPLAYGLYRDVTATQGQALLNNGTADAAPVITLTAKSSMGSISVTAGGKTMNITRDLVAEDKVVIDCKAHSVRLNDVDAMNILTIDSRFITLPAGKSTTISWNGDVTVRIQYNERWK